MENNIGNLRLNLDYIIDKGLEINRFKRENNTKENFSYLSYSDGIFSFHYESRGYCGAENDIWWEEMTEEELTLPLDEVLENNRKKAEYELFLFNENKKLIEQKTKEVSIQNEILEYKRLKLKFENGEI